MSFQAYMTIEGSRQKKFLGDSNRRRLPWRIKVLSIQVPATVLRDAPSGQASGKRQYEPIRVVKEWGASSPQLLQALTSNELLTHVAIVIAQTGGNGQLSSSRTYKLASANVVGIRRYPSSPSSGQSHTHEVEEVSFTFQQITVEHNNSNGAATDDWDTTSSGSSASSGHNLRGPSRVATLVHWPLKP